MKTMAISISIKIMLSIISYQYHQPISVMAAENGGG